jgi:hypothetical protein
MRRGVPPPLQSQHAQLSYDDHHDNLDHIFWGQQLLTLYGGNPLLVQEQSKFLVTANLIVFLLFSSNLRMVTNLHLRWCIQKFPDWVDNEVNNNKHSLRSNTKGYGDKTH